MKTKALLMLAAIMAMSPAIAGGPALAQGSSARWKPSLESVIISAMKPTRNYRTVLSSSRVGEALFVSASIDVPYSDLNLANEPDASELGRRIHIAARLVCRQLDLKYPPSQYPILDGFDCERTAAREGMDRANTVIAAKQ